MNTDKPTWLDRAVEWIAELMDGLGLNGTGLRWKWRRNRSRLGQRGRKAEMAWRAAQTKHKMCPECRALVERAASSCPQCGESMTRVNVPGVGRAIGNLFPGMRTVTGLILLVNGFVFLALLMAQAKAGLEIGLFSGFDWETLVRFGGGLSVPYELTDGLVTGGEWWRLVTPIFLHGSMLHFFFNSFWLVQLGPLTEGIFGTRYWLIYLLSGLAGSIASQWTRPVMMVGASGAIAGLFGLLLVHGWRHRSQLGQAMKSLAFRMLFYTVVMMLMGVPVDNRAHAGGFICGALLAFVIPEQEPQSQSTATLWRASSFLGVLLVLAAFAMVAGLGK